MKRLGYELLLLYGELKDMARDYYWRAQTTDDRDQKIECCFKTDVLNLVCGMFEDRLFNAVSKEEE